MTSAPTPYKLRTNNGLSISNSLNAQAFNSVRNEYMNTVFPSNFYASAATSTSKSSATSKMQKTTNTMTWLTTLASIAMGFGPMIASLFKGKNSHKNENNSTDNHTNNTDTSELSDAAKDYKKASTEDKKYYGTILENEISQSEKDVEAKKSSLSGIETEIKNATLTMESAKKFVEEQNGKIPQAKTAISSMAAKIAGKKAELATIAPDDPRYCELENAINVAEADKTKMEKDLEALQASITEKQKIVDEQTEIINKKTADEKQITAEITKLEAAIRKNKSVLGDTKSTTPEKNKPEDQPVNC